MSTVQRPFKAEDGQTILHRLNHRTVLIYDSQDSQFFVLMHTEYGGKKGWYHELELVPNEPYRIIPGHPLTTVHKANPELVALAQQIVDTIGPFLP